MKRKLLLLTTIFSMMFGSSAFAQYCTTNLYGASGCSFGDDLDNVTIGTYIEDSLGCTPGGYADLTADTISVQQSSPTTIAITSNFSSQFYGLWIDANNDSDFADAGEFIWNTTVGSASANDVFFVPTTVATGFYRMRLRGKYAGSALTAADACTNFTYGETHDYIVEILPPPPCPNPFAFMSSNASSSSLDISFSSTNNLFYVEYGPCGFTQGTGTVDTVTSSTFTVSGLSPNTGYEFYVQSDCGSNGISGWVKSPCFLTNCSSSTEGYSQNFDALTSNAKDPCWYDLSYGGGHTVYALAPSSFSNVQAFSSPNVYYWYNAGASWSYVMTPELEGLDGDTTQIKFRMAENYFTVANIQVFVGTMSDRTDTSTIAWVDTIVPAHYQWTNYTMLMDNVPAGHKYVVFARNNATLFSEIDIDNFVFEGIPSCLPPTNESSMALSSSSGMVSWTSTGTLFNIEYGPSGFTQGTGTMIMGATNPDTLTGLFSNTCYDVYIQQDCGGGSVSPWVLTTFCTPCAASPMPYSEDFTSWPPQCFVLTNGGFNWDHHANGHARANFWGNSSGTAFMKSGPIDITQKAQVKFSWAHQYQTFYPDDRVLLRARVLGGQWDTIKDLIGPTFNSPNSSATLPPAQSDFVDELIYLDSATYTGQVVELEFVGITDFGPVAFIDDFIVEAVPSCPEPTQISATNIQGYQASINWMFAGGTQFVIEYGPQGFVQSTGGGTLDTTNTSPYLMTGLTPVSCYDVYVMALCGTNGVSTWAGPYTFCTTVSCPAPTGVNATSVTTTSATIDWVSGGASNYNYVIGPAGTTPGTGTVMAGTAKPIMLSSLTPATSYSFWIQDSCGLGDASTWTGPFNFATLCNPFSLNFTEDFVAWAPPSPPLCWNVDGGTQTVLKNGNNAEFNFWGWPSPNDAYLTSPAVNISQKARLKVSWSSTGSTFYNDTVFVLVKETTASTWDTLDVWGNPDCLCGATNTAPSATPIDSIYTLDSNYVGSDIQVRFYGKSGYGPDVYIHNVIIEVDPAFASCPAPQGLTATNITSSSADLGWTSTATSFEVSYGSGSFPVNMGTKVITSNNPYSLTGLNASSQYSFYVRALCGGGDTSVWNGPFTFNTACGTVMAPFSESFDVALSGAPQCWTNSNVQGNTSANAFWKHTSVAWGNYGAQGIVDHTGNSGYAMGVDASTPYLVDVELVTPPIDISNLSTPTLSFWVFMNNTNTPGAHNDFQIDLYDGTSWNDSIFGYANDSSDWVEVIVPLTGYTITGPINIRFAIYKVGAPVNFYDDTMIDDILIDNAAGACAAPTNMAAANITCTGLDLTWVSDAGTVQTGMVYDTAGFNPLTGGTVVLSATSPYTISGLTPGTAYDFYIVDSCSSGLSSPVMISATTASGPLPTLSLTSMQTDTTATTAEWTFDASASTDYTSITWEFGDGSANGTNAMEMHDYNANQAFTVTVTLTNDCGSVDSTFTVNVQGINIEESALGRTLKIFPNPTAGNVNVEFQAEGLQNVEVRVTNALGSLVYSKDLGRVSGSQNVSLDLSKNASGIYMIQIITDRGTITKRLTLSSK